MILLVKREGTGGRFIIKYTLVPTFLACSLFIVWLAAMH